MELTRHLHEQGYDLITGPVRNHNVLQLWLKKPLNEIEEMYRHVTDVFNGQGDLTPKSDAAIQVDASMKNAYDFGAGASALDNTLKAIGIQGLNLQGKITGGRSVAISYDNASTQLVPVGTVSDFLAEANFKVNNPITIDQFNRNNVILITGILVAKNLVVDIESSHQIDANVAGSINQAVSGKASVQQSSANTIRMVTDTGTLFPVAVKAMRLQYHNGRFAGIKPVTDNRDLF